ncbi:MAG: tRNA lysidine(34) synthetase TilS [Gemmatimonadaceae bacterium]
MTRASKAVLSDAFRERVSAPIRAMPPGRYLLAISGGRDSMVLLDAFTACRADVAAVGTFDHGTGLAAERAARMVEAEGALRGVPVVSGRGEPAGQRREAAWRAARWEFLSGWAKELSATVVTAHTLDDQLETVVIRVLRDPRHTSARGLAAMYARSPVARPLLGVRRADIAAYAAASGVRYVDDPSNLDRAHLRNRVRLDLLPALEGACPGFGDEIIGIARRAATWRDSVERLVDSLGLELLPPLVVPADPLATLPAEALALLWPAIAARAGVMLDWRGTERLVAFTRSGRRGAKIPLSGGAEVSRTRSTFVVRGLRKA